MTSTTVYFLNGPNANLYGLDKSGTYGRESFASIRKRCEDHAASLGLTVDFARQHGLRVVVRGLRAVSDFEFEFQLATMSRHLSDQVDYVFLTPTEKFNFISSSLVREIAGLGGNVSEFVDPSVEAAMKEAWARRRV